MKLTQTEIDALRVKAANLVSQLMEAGCDSVRLIATSPNIAGGTALLSYGAGNFFAQSGAVRQWQLNDKNHDLALTLTAVEEE